MKNRLITFFLGIITSFLILNSAYAADFPFSKIIEALAKTSDQIDFQWPNFGPHDFSTTLARRKTEDPTKKYKNEKKIFKYSPIKSTNSIENNPERKSLLHAQCHAIFTKLNNAVADGSLPKWYARGAKLARKYIELRIDYPELDQQIPELTSMAQAILQNLPEEINIIIEEGATFN